MSIVAWPTSIKKEGICGIPICYYEANGQTFDNPQWWASVDVRLYIALAAAILDGIEDFNLTAISSNGIYNDRTIRGSSSPSTHSWGIAIDIAGFQTKPPEHGWWVENDLHKPFLKITASEIMRKYFPDVITWDVGQWQGGFPHIFSEATAKLHENHYHVNVSPASRFKVKTDKWHLASVNRVLRELGYNSIKAFQEAKGLVADGVAGIKTCTEIIRSLEAGGG